MPYIDQASRDAIDSGEIPNTPGELNYLLTVTVLEYIRDKGESYTAYNDALGALEGCKLELYRRHVAPYEDEKIVKNGDV
jgi:hypothetical protein